MKFLSKKKSIGLVSLMLVLSMILVACGGGGGSSTKELVGSDGSKLVVPGNWEKIEDDEAIRDMFNDGTTDVSQVVLAAESDTGRVTVEKYGIIEYYNEFLAIIDEIKTNGQAQGKEAMLAELESIGYTEYERNFLGRMIDNEELTQDELEQFFQEYYFQDWSIAQGQDPSTGYTYVGSEEITINGKPTRIHEYTYTQTEGNITLYETNTKKDNNIYVNIIWGYDEDFQNNKEEFKNILGSFTS